MTILRQQSSYNDLQAFGLTDNESISQSVYFERSFTLNSVNVKFDSTSDAPVEDIKLKCQIRSGFGPDHLLNFNRTVLDESSWYDDEDIPPTEFEFALNGLTFDPGHYWITILSNQKCYPNEYLLKKYSGGTFVEKFIKVINGSGIYRTNESLKFSINGSWIGAETMSESIEHGIYTITTLRDKS